MSYSIIAEGLTKRYGDTVALAGVDLQVRTGTVFGLLGPNGAGKTTAVRILATLIRPDSGHASVGGHDVVTHAHQVRQLIGLTGQYASVDESLTGHENLLLIGRLTGMSRPQARARAHELLADFRLDDAASRAVKTYSGGMRRRLDLAASLVSRPRILYLDEPTTGLDPISRNEMWDIVARLADSGVTVLLTTQYLEEADQFAADITVVDNGLVIATGTPEQLKSRTGAQTLAVRPADAARMADTVSVLAAFTGSEPEVRGGVAAAPLPDPELMPAIVRRLDDAGVVVAEINMRRPSLDDVFLTLTGHAPATPDDPGAGQPETGLAPERSLA
jgi:oleandomycin transport system ATP-binding protein